MSSKEHTMAERKKKEVKDIDLIYALDKKLDRLLEIFAIQTEMLEILTHDRCTCKKAKKKKEKIKEKGKEKKKKREGEKKD